MDTISWQGYEYDHHEKTGDWFWALGIIALSSAITAIIFENILFALLILIGAFAVALFAAKRPHLSYFEINRRGIVVDDRLFPFNTLESFWINEDEHGHETLIAKSNRVMMPYLIVPIHDVSGAEVHRALSDQLQEEELHEPISHRLLEFFGF